MYVTSLRSPWRNAGKVLLVLAAATLGAIRPAAGADWAVVLMYHRFGEAGHESTNIRLDQFDAHLRELGDGGYTVLPLPEIVAAVREGRELPDKAVAITIDDAYLSVYEEAWPRLRAAGFPFTIFIATDPVDQGFPDFMSWVQVREMRDAGVHIGAHTAGHLHLPAHTIAGVQQDLVRARERLEAELGSVPTIFAYPFGEASAALRDLIAGEGFEAAFGQHSGVTHNSFDRFFLPRFPLSEEFGDLERLRLVASALPIPIADLTPRDPQIQENPPLFGFTLTGDLAQRDGLACFATGQGQVELEWLGPRAEVRMPAPFSPGRARINCTAPAGEGRWRWLGMQYYVPR